MHDDLCPAVARGTHSRLTLHCWRPPHLDSQHFDRDLNVQWSHRAQPALVPAKRKLFGPRRPSGGVPVAAFA